MLLKRFPQGLLTPTAIKLKLSYEEQALRIQIINSIINTGAAFNTQQRTKSVQALIHELGKKNILTLDATGNVSAIYPVSATKTAHVVQLPKQGLKAYALCAIDALGFYETFDEPIIITSLCAATNTTITIERGIEGYRVITPAKDICVLYTDLNLIDQWAHTSCPLLNFFATQQMLEVWVARHLTQIAQAYYVLELKEAITVTQSLFA